MSYPTTRAFFPDANHRNEVAAIASIVRSLARAQNFRYARDLKVTPAGAKIFGQSGAWPWGGTDASTEARRAICAFGSTAGKKTSANVAEFLVNDPRSPATSVTIQYRVDRDSASTAVGSVTIRNATAGSTQTTALRGWSPGDPAGYWETVTVRASAGDIIQISAAYTSGTEFRITSVCAWWEYPTVSGVTFPAWSAMSQSAVATDRALSTALVRWLGQAANGFATERPLMVVASWLYNPAAGTGGQYSAQPLVVGRYQIFIGGRCPGITVRLRYRVSGSCSVSVALSGGASGTVTITSAGASTGSASTTIALTPSFGAVQELTLTVAGSPTYCDIEHVLVYESHSTASSLALPGAETVPASFDPNLDERMASARAIRADDLARLVANEVWLWAYRRDRILVNDCRVVYGERATLITDIVPGASGVNNAAAVHAIHTSKRNVGDAFGELLLRAGWHQAEGVAASPSLAAAPTFRVGLVSAGDYVGSPANGIDRVLSTEPFASWDSCGIANWQHAHGAAVAGETTEEFITMLETNAVGYWWATRPSWLVIEELPLDTPALTYP